MCAKETFQPLKQVKEEKIEIINSGIGKGRFFKSEPTIVKDEKPLFSLKSKGKNKKPKLSIMVACPVCKIKCKNKNLKRHKERMHRVPFLSTKRATSIKKESSKIVREKITSSIQLRLGGRKNFGSSKLMDFKP